MLLETLSNILSLTAYGSLSGTESFSAGTDRKAKAPLMLFDAKIAKKGLQMIARCITEAQKAANNIRGIMTTIFVAGAKLKRQRKRTEHFRWVTKMIERKMTMVETLCWSCKNAVPNLEQTRGCSWSRELVPVKGWDAIETKRWVEKYANKKRFYEKESNYRIIKCSKFIPDVSNRKGD